MKTRKPFSIASAIAVGLLVSGTLGALAQTTVGINFVNNGNSGVVNTNSDSLLSAETAGAPGYAQANWNNLGRRGDSVANSVTLTDSAGAATALFINWDAPGTFENTTVTALGTPDGKMMGGGINRGWTEPVNAGPVGTNVYNTVQGDKPLIYLSGLSAWFASEGAEGYSIVAYASPGGAYWDTCDYWIQAVSGDPLAGTMVGGADLTPHYTIGYYDGSGNVFNGNYNLVGPSNTNGSAGWGPNYIVFKGLTNDAALLRTYASVNWNQACLDGIQIAPQFPELPVAQTPTFIPSSTVYALQSVTMTEAATPDPVHTQLWYQWQSDDGSSGAAFTDVLNATNSTYTFTPTNSASPYNLQFQVIVTNIHGAVTSSPAMLTVNPAVAPVVTKDTTPGAGETPYPSSAMYTFVGGSVSFSGAFDGPRPITNAWQADTGSGYVTIPNSTNLFETVSNVQVSVTLTNLQSSDSGNYRALASNFMGSTPSTPTPVTVLADPAAPISSEAYAYAVFTNNPAAYWRLNETTYDVLANTVQAYDYSGHNLNATYGHAVNINQAGPALPGFEGGNTAVNLYGSVPDSWLKAPSLNLNTNTVTISMWINPSTAGTWRGLFTWVNGSDKASFGFGGNQNNGLVALGYNWNTNSAAAYNFNSQLYPPLGQWSFVSLVITPTNSTIYLYYTDGSTVTNLSKAVQTINNAPEAFTGGNIWIGSSESSGGSGNLDGYIDEVAVFGSALSEAQIQSLFAAGSGITGVAPYITSDISANPTNSSDYFPGQIPVQLSAAGAGMPVPNYQWQAGSGGVFTNLPNSGSFSGVNSGTLSINPVMPANYLDYRLVLANASGSVTSSVYALSQAVVPNNGLWTARYQFTNSSGYLWYDAYGSGSYSGPGVLGSGNYWNPIPGHGQWNGGSFMSVSDYMDDGVTPSGITCGINNASFSIAGAAQIYPSNNRSGLLSQFAYFTPGAGVTVANAIVLHVPNGTFNLALHGDNANWSDRGTMFTVHGANGDQSDMTTNTKQFAYFVNHDSSVVIANVQVTNGVLNVDAAPTPSVPQHSSNGEFAINAVEVQLVSYAPPTAGFSASATSVYAGQWFAFYDQASIVTNVVWDFGDGDVYTNVNGTVYHAYSAPGTYTVSQTVTGSGGTAFVTKAAYITVLSKPVIGNVGMSGGSLVLGGSGGISGQQYRILCSTNVASPLASWTPVWTNVFQSNGSYSYTNSSPTNDASFYIMVTP